MAAVFPTTLPDFDEPSAPVTTALGLAGTGSRTHVEHHRDLGDEIRAVAAKVGVDGSGVSSTLEYRVTQVESGVSGAVLSSLFNANTILAATADNTPAPLTVGPSTILGRKATGGIAALTPAEASTVIGISTPVAADVDFTPVGSIAATDVQAAIAELGTEKLGATSAAGGILSGNYPNPGITTGDITLGSGVYGGAGEVGGGVLRHVTAAHFKSAGTLSAAVSDTAIGSPVLVEFDNVLDHFNAQQAVGFFGPRAAIQIEGRVSYSQDSGTWRLAPLGFQDQLIVRNVPGEARNFTPAWQFLNVRIWAAEGATVTASKTDVNPFGPVGFCDDQTFITTGGGVWDCDAGGDYTMTSFLSLPVVAGNTTLARRHALYVKDVGLGGPAWAGVINGIGLRSKLSADVDSTFGTVNEQYGLWIDRLKNAGWNIGIECNAPVELWTDTATFTAALDRGPLYVGGTHTLDFASATMPAVFSVTPTILFKQAGLGFGSYQVLNNETTIKNVTTLAGAFGPVQTIVDSPNVTADTTAMTMAGLIALRHEPTLATVNGGTLTVADVSTISDVLSVGAGATATLRRALFFGDATGAGAVGTQIALDVARLTKGTTLNLGMRCDSPIQLWEDTAAFTANPSAMIGTTGVYTFSTGVDLLPLAWNFAPAYIVDTTLNALAVSGPFRNSMTYKSAANATVRDLKQLRGYSDTPTVQADTSADTMSNFASFYSLPIFGVLNGGTLAVSTVDQVRLDGPTINAGVTVTDRRGVWVRNPTGAGTLTNNIAIDIDAQTKGATLNIGIRNASKTVYTPPAAQNITAATDTISPTATTHKLTASASFTMTSAPTIPDGVDGQLLILRNVDTADTITIQDQGALANSNVRTITGGIVLGPRDSVMLQYDSTVGDWVQITPVINVV